MKKLIQRKTAGTLAFLMLLSLLLPVIAYAGVGFSGINTSNGTVAGQVYVSSDVYDGNPVAVQVYSGGNYVTTVYANYSVYSNGNYYYDFSVAGSAYANYSTLSFKYYYPDGSSVTTATYDRDYNIGGGGGGIFIPPASNAIEVGTDGKVDATKLADALKADGTATIKISGEFALLPASALKGAKSVTVVADGASYTLPLDTIDYDALAKSLGVDLKDLIIKVEIKKLAGDAAKAVTDAVYALGGKSLAPAVDFNVSAEGNGKSLPITKFGKYVSRTINLNEVTSDTSKLVGVVFDPVTKSFSFVPTSFSTVDGKTVATLKRPSNSIYTVISLDSKSFADLATHWSKTEVEKLASKLIVNGKSATAFDPNGSVTRAEFAAMVVRALGLNAEGTTDKFSDVSASAWYSGAVAAAAEAGIIKGYANGTFKPTATISREELATMVVRAMKFAGKDVTLTDAQASEALASFTDASKLTWSKVDVAAAVKAGIIQGSASKVAGKATATRAESAAMVLRFLTEVGFIK